MPFVKYSQFAKTTPSTGAVLLFTENGSTFGGYVKDILNLLQLPTINRDVSGNFTVSGNSTVTGDFTARGNIFLGDGVNDFIYLVGSTRISGDILHSGNFTTTGNSVLRGTNYFGGPNSITNVSGGFNVTGYANVRGQFGAERVISSGDLFVSGNSTLGDSSSDFVRVVGGLHVNGFENVNGQFGVVGTSLITGSGSYSSSLNVGGNFLAVGNSYLGGNSSVNYLYGSFNSQNGYNSGNLYVGNDLHATGFLKTFSKNYLGNDSSDHTYLEGSLYCRTGSFFEGSAFFKQNLTTTGNLFVTGNAIVSGGLDVAGRGRVRSNFDVLGNESVAGTFGVGGNTTLSGNLNVVGGLTIGGAFVNPRFKWVKFDGDQKTSSAGTVISHLGAGVAQFNGLASSHSIRVGDIVQVSSANGASASLYNGQFAVTASLSTAVQYQCSGVPTANSTAGKIDTVIKAKYGVLSVTRSAGGEYVVTFDPAFSSVDYTVFGSAKGKNFSVNTNDTNLATQKMISTANYGGGTADATEIHVVAQL